MKSRLIIDGNSVYEIDEECMRRKNEDEQKRLKNGRKRRNTNSSRRG